MNNKIFNSIMLTVGAAIGSAVTWKVVKTKYEKISDEEIRSVKEEYRRLEKLMRMEIEACRKITNANEDDEPQSKSADELDDDYPDDDERDFTEKEKEQINYYKLTSRYRSGNNDSKDDCKDENENNDEGDGNEEDEVPYINGPYVITPEEFSSSPPGYSACPLDYFSDGILADGWQVQVDVDETIGEDALKHFGEYVDDIVYVRNERNQIDYEVTRDPRTYQEAAWPCS